MSVVSSFEELYKYFWKKKSYRKLACVETNKNPYACICRHGLSISSFSQISFDKPSNAEVKYSAFGFCEDVLQTRKRGKSLVRFPCWGSFVTRQVLLSGDILDSSEASRCNLEYSVCCNSR